MTHLTNRFGHRGLRWACFPLLLMFVAALTGSPLRAQVDLAGEWTENLHEDMPERGDVAIGDYLSLPINDATRMRADTWDAEQWTMVEHLVPRASRWTMRRADRRRCASGRTWTR